MSILLRINLILGAAILVIALSAAYVCRSILAATAKRELLAEAGLMLDSAVAQRTYTANEIEPLLHARLASEFLPQSVPFYAATQNFLKLQEKYPQYAYKEATLNPTNPRDRAADWEADIVQRFRNDAGVHELSGVRDTPMGPSLYMARPIKADAECLQCHSRPALAPATMLARYGSDNGFGWQANEIVGAQVVSVPFDRATDDIEKSLSSFLILILGALLALWLLINLVVYVQVGRPLRQIVALADAASLGQAGGREFPRKGAQELVALGGSFERMRKSLEKAMKLLGS